jgi:hypothetical protein
MKVKSVKFFLPDWTIGVIHALIYAIALIVTLGSWDPTELLKNKILQMQVFFLSK